MIEVMLGWLIFGALLVLLLVQTQNIRLFPRLPRDIGGSLPPVSVLVPARNEERSIRHCVSSLLAQEYPGDIEVLVLDDDSTDGTLEILRGLTILSPRLRLIAGAPLPQGWTGKNWACAQLAKEARGDFLLFTDADTVHQPHSVAASVQSAVASGADLLSLMPRQRMESFWERALLPLMYFFYLTFFPRFMLERSADARFAAANGQYLLFRRSAYDRIGGHEFVRGDVVDDMALARRIRQEALVLDLADGSGTVECRMYGNLREIIGGFTKNLYRAIGATPLRALFISSALLALFTVPPLAAIATREFSWLVATLVSIWLRLRTTARTGEPFGYALLHPFAIAFAVGLLLRSMVASGRGGSDWKGRVVST